MNFINPITKLKNGSLRYHGLNSENYREEFFTTFPESRPRMRVSNTPDIDLGTNIVPPGAIIIRESVSLYDNLAWVRSGGEWRPIIPVGLTVSEGIWSITLTSFITAATASYSKISKQVALSGSITVSGTSGTITLPYTPDFAQEFKSGGLTIQITGGSTIAGVTTSAAGYYQFQINYKTA